MVSLKLPASLRCVKYLMLVSNLLFVVVDASVLTEIFESADQLFFTLAEANAETNFTNFFQLEREIQDKYSRLSDDLSGVQDNLLAYIARRIDDTTEEYKDAAQKAIDEAADVVDVQICANMIDEIDEIGHGGFLSLFNCFMEHTDEASAFIRNSKESVLPILFNVNITLNQREENAVSVISLFKTLASVKLKEIQNMRDEMMKFLTNLQCSYENCMNTHGLTAFKERREEFVQKIHDCIELRRSIATISY